MSGRGVSGLEWTEGAAGLPPWMGTQGSRGGCGPWAHHPHRALSSHPSVQGGPQSGFRNGRGAVLGGMETS